MSDPSTEEYVAEFNAVANRVSREIGDQIVTMAEQVCADHLDERGVFYAAVNGAITGALRVLDATRAIGTTEADEHFEVMMRQMADTWGQMRGERSQHSGSLQ